MNIKAMCEKEGVAWLQSRFDICGIDRGLCRVMDQERDYVTTFRCFVYRHDFKALSPCLIG
jgi:hypothetical protein